VQICAVQARSASATTGFFDGVIPTASFAAAAAAAQGREEA